MVVRWLAVVILLAAAACSGSGGGCPPCPSSETCIQGGTCAVTCSADGGVSCPSGTTCQQHCGNCQGTGCACVLVQVCL